jgi:LysR family cys regulon transcriptional activator
MIWLMKLQQLRFLCEVAASMNVTAAAASLYTSQSGVSRQIRLLEQELGTAVLIRQGNKILGLTEAGTEIVAAARRLLTDADQLQKMASSFHSGGRKQLSLATTHLHARYALLPVIASFSKEYPEVSLRLVQLFADEVHSLVAAGQVDLGISTKLNEPAGDLIRLPLYEMTRCVIAPVGHPLLDVRKPSLRDICRFPLIVYDSRVASSSSLLQSLTQAGASPNVVLTAMDADVIKAYVASGLGVAVIQSIAFEAKADRKLRAISLSHILKPTATYLFLRRGKFVRQEMYGFIARLSPALTKLRVQQLMEKPGTWN